MPPGRPKDPLKSFTLPGKKTALRTGGGKRKSSETPKDFVDRMSKTFPGIITAVEGNIALAALYYDVEERMCTDVAELYGECKSAYLKARAVAVARERDGASVADILKRDAADAVAKMPTLPRRERWPVDEDERAAAIRTWLIDDDVLVLYEGDLSRISDAGTIPLHQLVSMVAADGELARLREVGFQVKAERTLSRLCEISERSNQPTATLKILQAFGGDRWNEKSSVTVKNVGFEAPKDDEAAGEGGLVSVLRRVK